jgi:dihydrofolate reductase
VPDVTVIVNASVSLDGYSAGPRVSVTDAMGRGGDTLHHWLMNAADDPTDADAVHAIGAGVGATVLGRRTYDVGIGHWDDVPFPGAAFVLTHRPGPDLTMPSGAFHFLDTDITDAITRAAAAAGDRDVAVMGADTARQALAAGLVDELRLQFVPVLLGAGTRLLDAVPAELHQLSATASGRVVHAHYRLTR